MKLEKDNISRKQALRLAPSPTGFVHIGTIRNAIYNYLEAKRRNASYILRIEDTDKKREVSNAYEDMIKVFDWFGLKFDEGPDIGGPNGPYVQSKRLDVYPKYSKELIEKGWAYYCFCTEEELNVEKESGLLMYSGKCRTLSQEEIDTKLANNIPYVIRLKVPKNRILKYHDLVFGDLQFDTNSVDDQVLLKSDGFPTYHLAVVVDDHLMGVTLMTRGTEWLSSTPKQLLLYEAFGWELPEIAHITPILRSDKKKKLGKRDGDVSAADYIKKGYLKEALINYLVMTGWHPKDDREIFSLSELEKEFSMERFNKAGSAFDVDKLNWFNKEYLKKMSAEEIYDRLKDVELDNKILSLEKSYLQKIIQVEKTRLNYLSELNNIGDYYFDIELNIHKMVTEKEIFLDYMSHVQQSKYALDFVYKILIEFDGWDDLQKINNIISDTIDKLKKENGEFKNGELYHPLRISLSRSKNSPSPVELLWVLGKEMSLLRIEEALKYFLHVNN